MKAQQEVRKVRCSRCVCPKKHHEENVRDKIHGCAGDFIGEDGITPWACWMYPKKACKGCADVLNEISISINQ